MLWNRYTRYSNLLFVANEGVNTLSLCMYVPFYSTFLSLSSFLLLSSFLSIYYLDLLDFFGRPQMSLHTSRKRIMITIEMQSQQKILYIQLKGRYFIIVNTFSSNSTIHVGIAPWRMLTTTKEVVE